MNALQSYSSDDNSGDECKPKQSSRVAGSGDHGTNYDDVGMDISEDSGDEGPAATSGGGTSNRSGGRDDSKLLGSSCRSFGNKSPAASANGGHHNHHRDGPEPRRGLLPLPGTNRLNSHNRGAGYGDRGYRDSSSAGEDGCKDRLDATAGIENGSYRTGEEDDHPSTGALHQTKEEKQYSSLQERLLGLASGKATEPTTDGPAKREGGGRRSHDERRSSRDDRRSRSPKDRSAAAARVSKPRRSSRSPSHRSGRRSPHSRSPKDGRSKSKEIRSRSKDRRSKSKERKRRSGSKERRSRSRDRRSRSRDRRSRSRSRDRRDRRRRSRSRDRRRDHRKDGGAKPGLLPLPTAMPTPHPPPLLAMPLIPPLPSYYNPNSVNALKYAEQERKKKLLWGSKSGSDGPAGGTTNSGSITGLLSHPPTAPGCLGSPQPPPALLALARNNPTGRELNLGLGKNQFSVGGGAKNLLGGRSLAGTGGRELNLGMGSSQPSGGVLKAAAVGGSAADKSAAGGGMVDLWATTTFNNDTDGKVAEKFKRLMGVKQTPTAGSQGLGTPGEKLTEKQENMFTNMERQYEVARLATHTHKGFGLGFTSSAYLPK